VEQFEQIRRDRERAGLSIRELARRHGVHRRTVRQALVSPLPPPRKSPERRPAPKLGPYRPLDREFAQRGVTLAPGGLPDRRPSSHGRGVASRPAIRPASR
jgi:transposase